jgi:hypothetical protein
MPAPFTTTLLDLVQSVSAVITDEREVVATITALVNSGRVRLSGNFAGATITFPSLGEFLRSPSFQSRSLHSQ